MSILLVVIEMGELKVGIPAEVEKKMKRFLEINWSGFVEKAIEQKIDKLERMEEMLKELEKEQEIIDWSVKLQRASRKGRFEQLKKKGLV